MWLLEILLFLIPISFEFVATFTSSHNESIFLNKNILSYCDMSCNGNKHTLCSPSLSTNCSNFLYFDENEYRDTVWLGQNGLRNRVAEKHNVSNMRLFEWNHELAAMAKYWLMQCRKYQRDPCTDLNRDKSLSYTLVGQNVAFLSSKYLPQHFYQMMIRKWYIEKWTMNSSHLIVADKKVWFHHFNNYTQIVWAITWRLGCAAGRYDDGYALVCNYHAISHDENEEAWHLGETCSSCPSLLPLCSLYFRNLCTNDNFAVTFLLNDSLLGGTAILTILIGFII